MIDRNFVKAKKQAELKYCAVCLLQGLPKPRRGVELHEIVTRAATIKNEVARNLSFAEALTVIICHEHHQENHQSGSFEEELWQYNIDTYGREAVVAALDELQASMRSRLGVVLPE